MRRSLRTDANRAGRLLAALVLALVAGSLVAVPAHAADDLLVSSDPYEHQELSDPPSGVVLAFDRKVDAAAAQIVVTNSDGASVNINSLMVEGTNVTAQVKPNLPKGTYTVHYQVNRSDGQVEGGAFQFSYGSGTWTTLKDRRWSGNTAQPTVIASAQPDPATATSSASASTSASTEPSSGAEPTTPDASASASASAMPDSGATSGSGATGWLIGGGVVVLAAVAGGAVLVARRRGAGQ